MSKHAPYSPKHRKAPQRPLVEAPKKAARTTLLLSTLAVAGTGAAVVGGIALHDPASGERQFTGVAAETPAQTPSSPPAEPESPSADELLADRAKDDDTLSRSADRRAATDPAKRAALAAVTTDRGEAITEREDIASGDPKSIASALLASYGWSGDQFGCLDSLWTRESGWRVNAYNPSGAYGIPQALPGSKMASAGPDWQTNPETQIKWGLGYIQDRYGSPCGAWAHSESNGWY
ncbi:transglycosylase SLT domain-containing protein [Nocardioides cheoyonin]|uniref:aggregation-promoting factor C-terminal-like domain-containing protein n=1 Tax=Nocardioides cheoyonin TaxID=3156615 RepID=UPI0032B59DD1